MTDIDLTNDKRPILVKTDVTPRRAPAPSSRVTIKVNCGCGRTFTNLTDAQLHAQTEHHILHISGEIRASYAA